MANINPGMQPKMNIDQARVEAAGIRAIQGKHLTLYTDVRDQPEIDELPDIFDQAMPLWCQYFQVDVEKTKPYRLSVFVMSDEEKFRKAGLIPADLPKFPAGLNRGHEAWIYIQKDAYYTRHLLIHEGTHAFMQWFGWGVGAPWFAEGMAELLGIHRWQDDRLDINFKLTDRKQSEGWGRPKLIGEQVAADKFKTIDDVLLIPPGAFQNVESYAWSWAACEFFSSHELTKEKFNAMHEHVARPSNEFNEVFYESIRGDIDVLSQDWRLFIEEMDYGYQVRQGALAELKSSTSKSEPNSFELQTQRSWQQATSVTAKSGDKFRIVASGRFQVGESLVIDSAEQTQKTKPWPCEANGVSLEYFRDRPLGELHAMFLPAEPKTDIPLPEPIVVGLDKVITAPNDGVLCLRINESPAKLGDNKGTLEITVEKID